MHKTGILISFLLLIAYPCIVQGDMPVTATSITLNPDSPETRKVGKLLYLGGLQLESEDDRFGGFSALHIDRNGHMLLAITDRGDLMQADLGVSPDGAPISLQIRRFQKLLGVDGLELEGKPYSDAESLAFGSDGVMTVSFERKHRILRYDNGETAPSVVRPPPELGLAPKNGGIEAMTHLRDGRLVVISESIDTHKGVIGWVEDPDANTGWSMFTYETDGFFRPTAAATLPNGTVLVLERFYTPLSGNAARVVSLGETAFVPRARIKGTELSLLKSPLSVDNFEGLAVHPTVDGRNIVYLISDDNFNPLQRTLLMAFELVP